MRLIEYHSGEPFELDPEKIESVEARVQSDVPAEGKSTGVVVLTMLSGRQHTVVVSVWDAPGIEVESNEILDVWAAIVAEEDQFCSQDLAARTFRKRMIRKG